MKRGCGRILLWGVIIIGGLLVLSTVLSPNRTPATTGAPPTATATAVRPFQQSAPPPLPTSTPDPPTPTPDIALLLYSSQAQPHIGAIGSALGAIGELVAAPNIADESWRIRVAMEIVNIRTAHTALLAIQAPPTMQGVHSQTISASAECNDATYLLASGLDTMSASLLDETAQKIAACGAGLQAAMASLLAIAADSDAP